MLFICSFNKKNADGGRDGEGGQPRAGHQGHGGPAQTQGGPHAHRRDKQITDIYTTYIYIQINSYICISSYY